VLNYLKIFLNSEGINIYFMLKSKNDPCWRGYELAIFGKQEKAEGLVYKFNGIPVVSTS
jgi:hypothetical protein